MLVDKWAALRGVTLEAGFVSAQESKPACSERLLNIRAAALDRDSLMRIVTIGATHFAFQHRMVVRQLECRANFQVTLETRFWRLAGVDNRVRRAATFDVQTARPVARLAAHVLCVLSFRLQSRVRRCSEIAHDFFVAGLAFLRADEFRARDAGRRKNCSVRRAARKQNYGERGYSPYAP
jgi:hypothetical protein